MSADPITAHRPSPQGRSRNQIALLPREPGAVPAGPRGVGFQCLPAWKASPRSRPPGPNTDPAPPDKSSSQGVPTSGHGKGGPSPQKADPLNLPGLRGSLRDQPLSTVRETPKGWSQPIFQPFLLFLLTHIHTVPRAWLSRSLPYPCLCSLFPECPRPSNKLLLIPQGPAETSHSLKMSLTLPGRMSPRGACAWPYWHHSHSGP